MLKVTSEKCRNYMNNSFSDIVVAFLVKNTKQIGIVLLMREYVGVTQEITMVKFERVLVLI